MRTRRTRLLLGCVKAKTGWQDSKLVFTSYNDKGEKVEAIISIRFPYEIPYIRKALNEIAAYWKDQVKDL